MQWTQRFAPKSVEPHYPFPITAPLEWTNDEDSMWRAVISLPNIPAAQIIIPSFAQLEADYDYSFAMALGEQVVTLHPVPAGENAKPPQNSDAAACSAHIDCWHTKTTLAGALVILRVKSKICPAHYLLTLSTRPLDLDVALLPAPSKSHTIQAENPISQMQANKSIRHRICSPTALTMALSQAGLDIDWLKTVDACYDPITKAYGSWPLAIRQAAALGRIAAVECFSEWSQAEHILSTGQPIVCSIRFAAGELSGAPLEKTGGHLVGLYGIGNGSVHVLDPAAATHEEVARTYDLTEFTNAWLSYRGAGYVFGRTTLV